MKPSMHVTIALQISNYSKSTIKGLQLYAATKIAIMHYLTLTLVCNGPARFTSLTPSIAKLPSPS